MTFVELLVVGLAVWQAVEILHHAEISLPLRRSMATLAEQGQVAYFFNRVLECPFCLSVWVAGLFLPVHHYGGNLAVWFVNLLAISRLANLGNDVFYRDFTRTPRYELDEQTDDEPDVKSVD